MTKPFYMGPVPPRLLDADGFRRLASKYNVSYAKLRAVCEVEANGVGIHSSGAVTALYEPHIAWRYTSGKTRANLAAAGLAYEKWVRKYPKTSYPRIDQCTRIAGAEVAALASSWGLPQMMGFNYAQCGYTSALDMVRDFAQSEENQISAMLRFIQNNRAMYEALHRGDWAGFAQRYNGPGYAQNRYDERLAGAYKKWLAKGYGPSGKPQPTSQPTSSPDVSLDDTEAHWLVRIVRAVVDWLLGNKNTRG